MGGALGRRGRAARARPRGAAAGLAACGRADQRRLGSVPALASPASCGRGGGRRRPGSTWPATRSSAASRSTTCSCSWSCCRRSPSRRTCAPWAVGWAIGAALALRGGLHRRRVGAARGGRVDGVRVRGLPDRGRREARQGAAVGRRPGRSPIVRALARVIPTVPVRGRRLCAARAASMRRRSGGAARAGGDRRGVRRRLHPVHLRRHPRSGDRLRRERDGARGPALAVRPARGHARPLRPPQPGPCGRARPDRRRDGRRRPLPPAGLGDPGRRDRADRRLRARLAAPAAPLAHPPTLEEEPC